MLIQDSLPPDIALKTIAEIGVVFDENYVSRVGLLSNDYLLDADILFISISAMRTEFSKLMSIQGASQYYLPDSLSQSFESKFQQRKEQIDQYLNSGGILFVIMDKDTLYKYRHESTKNTEVVQLDFLEVLSLSSDDFAVEQMKGSNIVYADSVYTKFFNPWDVSYDFFYKKFIGYPIAKVKNTNQPISVAVPHGKGLILLLPQIGLSADSYSDYESRQQSARRAILNFIYSYQESKPKPSDITLPEWCNDYFVGDEQNDLEKLHQMKLERDILQRSINNQEALLEQYNELKQLFTSTGKTLELMVEKVFSEMGFEIMPTTPGRDDLIVKYKDKIGVIEIKGVKGSASEQNAAQLMKWVSNFHYEYNIEPKGILLVNTFRNVPLQERKENSFPHQMLLYANRMQFCLMTTTQLLGLYLDFKGGDKSQEDVVNLVFNTIGPLLLEPEKVRKRITNHAK